MLTGIGLPIFLAVLATIAALLAHRGIQRGGARYYTLERDAILRRAGFTLFGAIVLFIASIALLVYGQQVASLATTPEPSAAELTSAPTPASADAAATELAVESQPPTPDLATLLATAQDVTPTAPITLRRGEIIGTGGSGAYLRDTPSIAGAEIEVLDDGTLLTFLDMEEPVEADGYTWIKVRTLIGLEGWVVDIYLQEIRR